MSDAPSTSLLVIALHGPAGAGKSTLAVRFAHLVADDFVVGQPYLDLRGNRSDEAGTPSEEALLSLLYGLGAHTPDVPRSFDARMGMFRSTTARKRQLLVLDNVRDAAQIRPLLPSSPGILVLLTSRRPLLDLAARDGAHLLRVDVPDVATARELLRRRLAGLPCESARTLRLDNLVERCGRLPLALALLAARLTAHPSLPLATAMADLPGLPRTPPSSHRRHAQPQGRLPASPGPAAKAPVTSAWPAPAETTAGGITSLRAGG
jgi:hypothetical protein